jgi:hypothetical protein
MTYLQKKCQRENRVIFAFFVVFLSKSNDKMTKPPAPTLARGVIPIFQNLFVSSASKPYFHLILSTKQP